MQRLIVNYFVWPNKIDDSFTDTANKILSAREEFESDKLATLYDPITMLQNLYKMYRANNKTSDRANS